MQTIPPETWKKYTERAGSQLALAQMLHVRQSTISRWLNGERPSGWAHAELARRLLDERDAQDSD